MYVVTSKPSTEIVSGEVRASP
ncbi:hypothetical protein AGR2A_Lc180101 [Agrobacterium genomosp. 2 str. CFBP 5494]|uniref:Uncharacterized protein n=1 Tax=Agrobacterium genomosp. 2 str. CFBP 5494 TaxID=1183436 RepID=A0A9W5B479_9HYPH|nr:hypothetical protein AGR2A_Lc180101 [Agrobacterium genomosp. 2 str. CFBP 5494]